MENPIKMDDLGVPLFLETPTLTKECVKQRQVLIELLVGRPPAVLAQDGHSCVIALSQIG